MAVTMATMAAVMQNVKVPAVQPEVIKLPSPPALVGALSVNQWLAKAKKHAWNMVIGPESMVVVNRYVYTGLQNGWVVEIRPDGLVRRILRMSTKECGRITMDEKVCGRPMGIRVDPHYYLVVADAYKGIYRINPRNGAFKQLVDASIQVKGRALGYINDLAITRDGTIFFTSSSSKHNRTGFLDILLEAESTGRVMVYNPRQPPPDQVRVLVSNLHFPNGLQLSRDESYLLIGEGASAKIHRAWIGRGSPKMGTIETFADNLPGFVDNIRLSPRNTYWVALNSVRSKDTPSLLDRLGDKPDMRRQLLEMPRSQLQAQMPKHNLVVELNENGDIIRSLHDPRGQLFSSISEVEEENGILYLGSPDSRFVGALDLRFLPPPRVSAQGKTGDQGTTSTLGSQGSLNSLGSSPELDSHMDEFLERVRTNTRGLTGRQLQDVVLLLVKRLVDAVMEMQRVLVQANELRKDLTSLQEQLSKGQILQQHVTTTAAFNADTTTIAVMSTSEDSQSTPGNVGNMGTIPLSWLQPSLFSTLGLPTTPTTTVAETTTAATATTAAPTTDAVTTTATMASPVTITTLTSTK